MRTFLAPVQNLHLAKFWLLVLAGGLIALHLHSSWEAKLTNLVVTSILFFGAIIFKLKQKRSTLNLESNWFSKIIGVTLVAFVFFSQAFLPNNDFLIRLLPFISGLGLALIASGIKGLNQYWQELMLLLVLGVPLELLIEPVNQIFHITKLLAKISTFILWYIGFQVTRQGDLIILPEKATWVGPNCSGVLTMLWMLQLAILFLTTYPTNWRKKILFPVVAVLIVMGVNGIRIAIMALLAAYNYPAFEYWHSDNAQIFSTIPLLIFWWFCQSLRENR
ncbi:MAG TPA: cyanoexosortase A [Cyanobacteria bacterium UBA11372]|nr:cyanoexosortase A [Cyanobacteria bacterium UBA11372]